MSKEQWHYTDKSGNQLGPISKEELKALIADRQIPLSSMVWKNSMTNWEFISKVDELKDTEKAPLTTKSQDTDSDENLYATPKSKHDNDLIYAYSGIGRLAYFGLNLLLGILPCIAIFALMKSSSTVLDENTLPTLITEKPLMLIAGYLVFIVFYFVLLVARLRNIGMNSWLSLLIIVPFVNIYLSYKCITCQEGYVETRKLDIPGKIIAWLYLITVFVFIALIALSVLFFGANAYKEGAERAQQIIDERNSQIEQDQPIQNNERIIPVPAP